MWQGARRGCPDHEQREQERERSAAFGSADAMGARAIGSVSYVFWGAYETVKRRGVEGEAGRGSEGTSRARWTRCVRPLAVVTCV